MTKQRQIDQILNDRTLSRDEKIEKLKRWKYDLEQLAVATEENMPDLQDHDDGEAELRDVVIALESLGYTDDPSDAK